MMRVAVVTGSNKGIGLAVVRALCKQFQGDVFLTSRDEGRGKEAVEILRSKGLNPKYAVLDLGKEETICKVRDLLKETYGGIDILVNNAGIAFSQNATESFGEQAKITLQTNYWKIKGAASCCSPS